MKRASILLTVIIFASCNGTGPTSTVSIQPGTYKGTFSITYFVEADSAFTQNSRTTFTFSDTGWYTCRGDVPYTPPSGGGEYKIVIDSLQLKDLVPHTAEFDWTLILNGSFHLARNGTTLTLTQNDNLHRRYRHIVLSLQSQ